MKQRGHMDTITHTLFGLTLYGAANKSNMDKSHKRALLLSTVVGSQIPDIDVVVNLTETGRIMQQMWHRGLTHSFFLIPIWGIVIYYLSRLLFKVKDRRIFYWAILAVFIHDTSDLFNTWGTGYIEPFSSYRVTFGTIPIVDFVFWFLMLAGFIVSRKKEANERYKVFRVVWLLMIAHVAIQSAQGYIIYDEAKEKYEDVALAAGFVPTQFQVIGKDGNEVEIVKDSIFIKPELEHRLISKEEADLAPLFEENPRAKTLHEWSPFVVVVEENDKLGIYDPRFYRNGESFLYEFIKK
jgi:inner membrane protein